MSSLGLIAKPAPMHSSRCSGFTCFDMSRYRCTLHSAMGSQFRMLERWRSSLATSPGAIVAFVTIILLRHRSRFAIPLAWLLFAETAYDTVSNIHGGIREHLMSS